MKKLYTIFLMIMVLGSLNAQNIVFSIAVDDTDKASVRVNIFARSNGADENLSGYTTVLYFNSAETTFSSYDQGPAQALGWSTADVTTNPTIGGVDNLMVPSQHDSKVEIQQFDANFAGSNVSSEPIQVGSVLFNNTNAGDIVLGGDVYLGDTETDPGIQYVNNEFTGFTIFTEGMRQQALPVEFSYFTASKRDLTSVLLWETASEINNDFFEVERSADGRSFQKIGKVEGNGTTTETQNYEFIDREPLAGINYYRLKQVDYNGDYEYSNVETVDFRDGTEGDVTIFPNPAADYVNVSLERSYDGIRITNQLGQLVEVLPAQDYESNQFRLDLTGYAPGVYFLEAKLGLEIVNKQFVKVK